MNNPAQYLCKIWIKFGGNHQKWKISGGIQESMWEREAQHASMRLEGMNGKIGGKTDEKQTTLKIGCMASI